MKRFEFIGYKTEKTSGVFHFQAIRDVEVRKIRVTIGKITQSDKAQVKEFPVNGSSTKKEIWCLLPSGAFKQETIL